MTTASTPRDAQARILGARGTRIGLLIAAVWLLASAWADGQPPVQPGKSDPPEVRKYRTEPKAFLKLMAEKPGVFAEKKILAITEWEKLTCVGFNPDREELFATVEVKLPFGYGGDLCQAGTREYVRFFVDYGAGWEDVGVAAFAAHDIPDTKDCNDKSTKPLHYVVGHRFKPKADKCHNPVLPRVRGILSWNWMPPAGAANANWLPPYGNRLEAGIQIKPTQPDKPGVLKPLPLAELKKLYVKDGKFAVQPYRFGVTDAHAVLESPEKYQAKPLEWKKVGLDLGEAVAALKKIKIAIKETPNVFYEELHCLGLDNTSYPERLVATFQVKRPTGYSGDLCHAGSREHVAFWADWDDQCKWTYLGTATVNVHDLDKAIPKGGLWYSAVLPVNLTHHRQECKKPKLGRVRAVLSWAVPPSATDPENLPYWGNRLDAHVQINPGPVVPMGKAKPVIGILGGIAVSQIDDASGLTVSGAAFALNGVPVDSLGRFCPFGGRVVLQGPQYPGLKYRIQVRKDGTAAWTTVVTEMKVWNAEGTIQTTVIPDAGGLFSFLVPTAANPHPNANNLLGWWDTTGIDRYQVKLELASAAGVFLPGEDVHRLQLNNQAPEVALALTSGGNCHKYFIGEVLTGTFVARHEYFGSFQFQLSPFDAPHGPPDQLSPRSGVLPTAPPPGAGWSLDTKGMKPCGYVLTVSAVDRTIVNSATVGHWATAPQPIGFCLDEKK